MKAMFLLICFVPLCVVAAGCGGSEYEGARRFPLSGKVSFNGEPVDVGSISFIPLQKDGRVSGGTIADGAYSVEEAQGANAGKHRIEIHWQKRTGKKIKVPWSDEEDEERAEGLPAEFNTDSTLTAEVSANQATFDFDLKSDKRPAPKVDDDVPEQYRDR
jgi:hypothetical protein